MNNYYFQNQITKTPVENMAQDFEDCLNELREQYKELTGKGLLGVGRIKGSIKKRGHKEYLIRSVSRGVKGEMVEFIKKHQLYYLLDEAVVLRHKDAFEDSKETIQTAWAAMKNILEK